MDRINDGPTFGHPRITRRAVELFRRWRALYDKDDESDDYSVIAQDLMRELHQPPWEYSALEVADRSEPAEWMLAPSRPHYSSWRAGRELYEALAKAAGVAYTPSAEIAATPDYHGLPM